MKPRFELADEVRFSCSRCGDCCRGWNVMLGPGEAEKLEALDWTGKAEDLVGLRVAARVRKTGFETRRHLRRRADGSCVYLGENHLCRIHEHFGGEHKPLLCRLYPFGFYPVGERVGVDVSFACRAVSEGRGESVRERVPEWTKLLGVSSGTAGAKKKRHLLRAGVPLPAHLVWEIEHYLLGFLSDASLDFFDRIRCALQFIDIGTTGDPSAPTASRLRSVMAEGIPVQIARRPSKATMDRTQRAIFYQWLFLCLNPAPHDLHDWTPSEQEREKSRRLEAGRRYLKRKGRPWVDNRELGVSFREIAAVDGRIFDRTRLCAPLEAFLKTKILGQKFLLAAEKELPLIEAAHKFLLTVPMTIWTAKALAAERGKARVEEADVRRSLRLIDRTLGALPTSAMPKKQAEACDFIMVETDLVEAATHDLIRSG